jgi:hypothetical protein
MGLMELNFYNNKDNSQLKSFYRYLYNNLVQSPNISEFLHQRLSTIHPNNILNLEQQGLTLKEFILLVNDVVIPNLSNQDYKIALLLENFKEPQSDSNERNLLAKDFLSSILKHTDVAQTCITQLYSYVRSSNTSFLEDNSYNKIFLLGLLYDLYVLRCLCLYITDYDLPIEKQLLHLITSIKSNVNEQFTEFNLQDILSKCDINRDLLDLTVSTLTRNLQTLESIELNITYSDPEIMKLQGLLYLKRGVVGVRKYCIVTIKDLDLISRINVDQFLQLISKINKTPLVKVESDLWPLLSKSSKEEPLLFDLYLKSIPEHLKSNYNKNNLSELISYVGFDKTCVEQKMNSLSTLKSQGSQWAAIAKDYNKEHQQTQKLKKLIEESFEYRSDNSSSNTTSSNTYLESILGETLEPFWESLVTFVGIVTLAIVITFV